MGRLINADDAKAVICKHENRMRVQHNMIFGIENIPTIATLTVNEYQKLAARTISEGMGRASTEMHALHGMASEIGELHGLYQKIYQGHKFNEEHAKKELGDLLWFIAEYCTANDWTLEGVMLLNIEKLMARYPEGFEAERSLHRKAGDI